MKHKRCALENKELSYYLYLIWFSDSAFKASLTLMGIVSIGWFIGVVMEAKPQLVGIHERVRNDIDAPSSSENGEKRISTAANPNAEEAADLLRYMNI